MKLLQFPNNKRTREEIFQRIIRKIELSFFYEPILEIKPTKNEHMFFAFTKRDPLSGYIFEYLSGKGTGKPFVTMYPFTVGDKYYMRYVAGW